MPKKTRKQHAAIAAFSKNLRAARTAYGFTQAQLAEEAGISVAYVSILERAGRNPPLTLVATLAEALHVDAATLMTVA
jgi:transcriptional regulator with XRE-family HTH domain